MAAQWAFGCAILAVLGPWLSHACDTKGLIVEKSFPQSVQDCVEYLRIPKCRLPQYLAYEFPPDEETKCLIYCVGTDLRWWNSTCGLQFPGMVTHFQPVMGDRHFETRTKNCVERKVRSNKQQSSCSQAYETFQCYFQEFGNLVTSPQYVPATKLQATQAAIDCLNILLVPVDLLQCYSRGELPDVSETRCVYHCIDLRTGLYTPETGILLSRFFVRDLQASDLRYLSKETKSCRDRIRQAGCDPCSEVYQTHQECLAGLGEDGYTPGIIAEGARQVLASQGISCSAPQQPVSEEVFSYESYQRFAEPPECTVCASAPEPQLAVPHEPAPAEVKVPERPLPITPPRLTSSDVQRKPIFPSKSTPRPLIPTTFSSFKPDPKTLNDQTQKSQRPRVVYYKPHKRNPPVPTVSRSIFSTFAARPQGSKLNRECLSV